MSRGFYASGAGRDRETGRFSSRSQNPFLAGTNVRALLRELALDVKIRAGSDIADQVLDRLILALGEWYNVMYKSSSDQEALAKMHAKLAEEMQIRIIDAYKRGQRGKPRIPSYRWADQGRMKRYANKAMLRALKTGLGSETPGQKGLIEFDYKGIYFPNTTLLDGAAKQWYRLNFGAEPASTPPMDQPKMKFGGQYTSVSLSLNSFKPSKPFMVPALKDGVRAKGLWSRRSLAKSPLFTKGDVEVFSAQRFKAVKGGYTGAFSPDLARRSALYIIPGNLSSLGFEKRLSKGIVGARFLDEGLKHLNLRYGTEISKLLNEWRRASNTAGKRVAEKGPVVVSPKVEKVQVPREKQLESIGVDAIDDSSPEAYFLSGGLDPSKGLLSKWRRLGFDPSEFF
jgi:hypothetical protein